MSAPADRAAPNGRERIRWKLPSIHTSNYGVSWAGSGLAAFGINDGVSCRLSRLVSER